MRLSKDSWLLNMPIAHRGLWGKDIIENSLPAYENAIKNNFAIEIDLYSSTDGEIYVFHDDSLTRMTGTNGFIYEKTSKELSKLKLANSEHTIPTFEQVLKLVNGRVPLLIELKNQPDKSYIDKVINRLKFYKGEFAIQSFDPFYINRVKKLAPDFIRGILGICF